MVVMFRGEEYGLGLMRFGFGVGFLLLVEGFRVDYVIILNFSCFFC